MRSVFAALTCSLLRVFDAAKIMQHEAPLFKCIQTRL
jgi:hypothetical protein